MKATGGATAHALMTAHRKTKDNWVMDGILHASALEQMGPRSQSVSSTYEQVKFGKLIHTCSDFFCPVSTVTLDKLIF